MNTPIITVQDVTKRFRHGRHSARAVTAVDGVSLSLYSGEILGLVGESGCGKTTLTKLLLRLLDVDAGHIDYQGAPISTLQGKALLPYRRAVQVVFQDPYGSLNPWLRVVDLVAEPLVIQGTPKVEAHDRARAMLERVGLNRSDGDAFIHRFSGGQRQRIAIARALVTAPQVVLCDEAVSALDVSVQSQILNLFLDLKAAHGLTYLFISHNLAVIRQIADRVAVMCRGQIIETCPADAFFAAPQHPYSQMLLAAVPVPDPTIPPAALPVTETTTHGACVYYDRCAARLPACADTRPPMVALSAVHQVACHLYTI